MLLVGFRGLEIHEGDPITAALGAGLGGVILFDRDQITGGQRNIASPKQLAALTAALRAAATGPLLIAIDQEGGKVSRLNPAQGFPATRTQAAVGATDDPAVAHAAGLAMGTTMHMAGIDLDLAPVVDVNVNPKNPAIGALGRSFSADPSIVAAMAEAEIRGLHAAGVRSTIKHFPGLGSAAANTDFAVVDVTATWTMAELEPYETLIGAGVLDAVMSGNIVNRKLDPDGVPASLSAPMIEGSLRGRLGWQGRGRHRRPRSRRDHLALQAGRRGRAGARRGQRPARLRQPGDLRPRSRDAAHRHHRRPRRSRAASPRHGSMPRSRGSTCSRRRRRRPEHDISWQESD